MHPALEIVDYARSAAALDDVIAHSMFHFATVLGAACAPEQARELDVRPALRVGPRSDVAARRDLVPRDPGELVAFVAAYLGAFGASLEADDWILSGSYFATALPLAPGDRARADFGALGSVSLRAAPGAGSGRAGAGSG